MLSFIASLDCLLKSGGKKYQFVFHGVALAYHIFRCISIQHHAHSHPQQVKFAASHITANLRNQKCGKHGLNFWLMLIILLIKPNIKLASKARVKIPTQFLTQSAKNWITSAFDLFYSGYITFLKLKMDNSIATKSYPFFFITDFYFTAYSFQFKSFMEYNRTNFQKLIALFFYHQLCQEIILIFYIPKSITRQRCLLPPWKRVLYLSLSP